MNYYEYEYSYYCNKGYENSSVLPFVDTRHRPIKLSGISATGGYVANTVRGLVLQGVLLTGGGGRE